MNEDFELPRDAEQGKRSLKLPQSHALIIFFCTSQIPSKGRTFLYQESAVSIKCKFIKSQEGGDSLS